MVFRDVSEEQEKLFFSQGYASHLPGYTGHCQSLKFCVGKGFGACTEEILQEMLEKKILKTGPYRPNVASENLVPVVLESNDVKRDWKNDAQHFKIPPYIVGYTGYIPGFSSIYGLTFMKAVEEGAKEWRKTQRKLAAKCEFMKATVEKLDGKNLLPRVRVNNVEMEIERLQNKPIKHFDHRVTPDRPPAIGYTGHIPGTEGDVGFSKRYTQAAEKGVEFDFEERESRLGKTENSTAIYRKVEHTRS